MNDKELDEKTYKLSYGRELYKTDGVWFLYTAGPTDSLGQHYDESNIRIEPAISGAFEEAIQSLLKQAELRGKIDSLTDFGMNYFMKNRQSEYDKKNLDLIKYEIEILETEMGEK